jgi:hypothetical protein
MKQVSSEAEIAGVTPVELGIAFIIFRSLVDPESAPAMAPCTDRYVNHCIEGSSQFAWAMERFCLNYKEGERGSAITERIYSFVLLLRRQREQQGMGWTAFVQSHDSFSPIVHAVALCPVKRNEPFDAALFMNIARQAPEHVFIHEIEALLQ